MHGDDPNPGHVGELVSHGDTYAPSQRGAARGAAQWFGTVAIRSVSNH